jgi:hypothetical protein
MPGRILPKPTMTRRRALPGLRTRPPLRDDAEYRSALAELHGLGQAALGTPATRGLQALVECILDYEADLAAAETRDRLDLPGGSNV